MDVALNTPGSLLDKESIEEWMAKLPAVAASFLRAKPGQPEKSGQLIAGLNEIIFGERDIRAIILKTVDLFSREPEALEAMGRPARMRYLSWMFAVWLQHYDNGYIFRDMFRAISATNSRAADILATDMMGFIKVVMATSVARAAMAPEVLNMASSAVDTLQQEMNIKNQTRDRRHE